MKVVAIAAFLLTMQAAAQSSGEKVEATASATAPSGGDEKCLKCHESISALLNRKVIHPAVDFGCTTCHIDHQAAAGAKGQARHYLTEPQPSLCSQCHDFKDKTLVAAHHG